MRVPFTELKKTLERVLLGQGFSPARARDCARLFAETDRDGVYSHGLNRFPRFLEYIAKGYVDIHAEPRLVSALGSLEVWEGNLGPGNLNARLAMARALDLARLQGIGAVALRNTNHWMRGGSYGWQAADAGCIGICFTNTIPNMPPWGGKTPALGNNPLILAVPRPDGRHVVLDMAMSQYSFGKLELMARENKKLPVPGGFDSGGNLTDDAAQIAESGRVLPIGFWKGAGLSLMLDLLASILSGGKTSAAIGAQGQEYGVSQVFIALQPTGPDQVAYLEKVVHEALSFAKSSQQADARSEILYPGEMVMRNRLENLEAGIPVDDKIWHQVLAMNK
ncbi:MAG: 3-dehydro-L-gulonate 2-dehydrogenase [Adhaeribacter sp.]